jgi:hypothetical protein
MQNQLVALASGSLKAICVSIASLSLTPAIAADYLQCEAAMRAFWRASDAYDKQGARLAIATNQQRRYIIEMCGSTSSSCAKQLIRRLRTDCDDVCRERAEWKSIFANLEKIYADLKSMRCP